MKAAHSLFERLLEVALLALLTVVVLSWAWDLLQPLLPLLVGGLVTHGFFKWQQHR